MNWIIEYYSQIKSGKVVVGKYIKKIYEMLVKGIEKKRFFFDASKANRAIKFIETMCHHCEGRSDLFVLEVWQKALVSAIFGILDKDGNRQFREVFVVMMRKQGKTLLASAIMAYMAYLDGEYGAKMYCVAPKLEQSSIIYDNFYQMLRKEPELDELAQRRRSDIYIASSNTSVKQIAFNAKKSDGFNPHMVICDEVASWQGDGGLKQYEVMKSALGSRRQPLILSISTAGYINDSIYDELMKRATAILKGSSNEKRFLPVLYMIDDVRKWNDINELQKAGPNLGVSVSVDFLLEEIAIAENSLSKKAEFMTKYCNIKQNSSQAWLDAVDVANISKREYSFEDFKGCYCVGGIDLSQTTDLTACSVVIEKGEVLYTFTQFFMPTERIESAQQDDAVPYDIFRQQGLLTLSGEHYVDYKDCYEWFVRLVRDHKIMPLKIGYDRYSAQYLVQDLAQAGFHMDDVFQGENLTPVINEFSGLVKDRKIEIGQNNLLKGHFLNVAMKENMETRKIRPVKIQKNARIDGFVSVIDALTVRQKYYSEIGLRLKNERK